jgi:hypothetical protein
MTGRIVILVLCFAAVAAAVLTVPGLQPPIVLP